MTPTKPKDMLSIVIITKDTKELLQQLLHSIENDGSLKSFLKETVIIDNASADGTGDMVNNEFPWAKYVRNDKNMGFAASANQGINRSTGEYVLLLNSDTVLIEGEIAKMLKFMEENDDAGICGPQLVYPDMRLQRSSASIPSLLTEVFPFIGKKLSAISDQRPASNSDQRSSIIEPSGHSGLSLRAQRDGLSLRGAQRRGNLTNRIATALPRDDHKGDLPNVEHSTLNVEPIPLSGIDVPSLIGAAIMIRRSLFRELSGFDEQFFFFLEETDLCVRAQQSPIVSIDNRSSIIEPSGHSGLSLRGAQRRGNLTNRIATASPRDDHKGDLPDVEHRTLNVEHGSRPYRVVLLPDVKVIHLQGKTVGKNWIRGRIEYNISLYKFIRKHHSALYYRSFQAVRFLKSIVTILVLSLLPFLLIGKGTRRRYIYYWTLFLWHLSGCPPTTGLHSAA
ncbi:MAG: Abequosyltransferase RfbV [Syntrophorhabdus sp. PtaU1.Bin058]|nr:MAG: Abequosyltransferase RfbV [Syntrophorhabdus sp. PtaU1.Bin058]